MDIALKIGSDVPFFIEGGLKFVYGRGEKIKPHMFSLIDAIYILLVFPKFSIDTSWAYKNIKKKLQYKNYSTKFPPLDSNVKWKLFENDFEDIVGSTYPEIFEIKNILYENGALYSGLSGSGSTMFGVYNDKIALKKTKQLLNHYNTLIVSPIQRK
jgi:4-diphosphocytidyl-2-C-methyl-D-erythritol kinase